MVLHTNSSDLGEMCTICSTEISEDKARQAGYLQNTGRKLILFPQPIESWTLFNEHSLP